MSPDMGGTIRVSQQAKEQMVKLKRATGIRQWNVLCRWALCTSLADPTPPLVRDLTLDSNVEMSWKTFAGSDSEVFVALLRMRAASEMQGTSSLSELLHIHIHRGLSHIAGLVGRDDQLEQFISLNLPA